MVTLQLAYKKSSISDRETISSMTNKLMTPSEADAIIFGATGNIYRRTKLRFSYSIYMLVYKCDIDISILVEMHSNAH
jgi:hypothetical protein